MNVKEVEPRNRKNPLGPLLGFIVFVLVAGFSILVAPMLVNVLENTTLTIGALGQVLPISFPTNWPDIMVDGLIALVMFIVIFSVFMLILFTMMNPQQDELDIDLRDIRAQKEEQKKRY